MEKVKIIYAFDNKVQFELASKSILSAVRSNSPEEISFIFLHNNCISESDIKIAHKIASGYEIESISFDENFANGIFRRAPGMFYWLFAPFYFEGERFLQIDNDTLVKTSIQSIFKEYSEKFEKNYILGAKTNISHNFEIKNKLKKLNLNSRKLTFKKYVNYGVLLFNAKLYREEMNEKELIEYLEMKTILANQSAIESADQEWMFEFFSKKTGFISDKYNARIHRRSNLHEAISRDDFILHYNFYYNDGNRRRKFDFHDFIYNKELSFGEKENSLVEIFNNKKLFLVPFTKKRNAKYAKRITSIFEELAGD